jgi:hypothetical protein
MSVVWSSSILVFLGHWFASGAVPSTFASIGCASLPVLAHCGLLVDFWLAGWLCGWLGVSLVHGSAYFGTFGTSMVIASTADANNENNAIIIILVSVTVFVVAVSACAIVALILRYKTYEVGVCEYGCATACCLKLPRLRA